jgi:tetratricopeptide (TPR) repeat protein
MRKFLVRLMIFLLPLLIIGSIGIGIAVVLGYALPLRVIVDIQQSDPRVIYRSEVRENIFHHKLLSINARQSAIAIFGSSRVQSFPDLLIKNPDDFYNMTIQAIKQSEILWMLQHINSDSMPEIIILNIDPIQLNNERCNVKDVTFTDLPSDFEQIIIGTRDLWQDVLLGDVVLDKLFQQMQLPDSPRIRIGAMALTARNMGYNATGYGLLEYVTLGASKNSRNDARQALVTRSKIYRSGSELCITYFDIMEQFLQLSEEYGITTIGMVLPYLPDAYEAFTTESDFTYFPKAIDRLEQTFAQNDVRFYDFSNPSLFDADETYFTDGHHFGSVLSAKIFYAIVQANPELFAQYVDLDELDQIIRSARHPFALSNDVKLLNNGAKATEQIDTARELINAKEYEQVIELLTRTLEISPSDARIFTIRARAYMLLDQLDNALNDINLSILLKAENTGAYRLRARIYRMQGDIESSIADYNHTLELDPMNFDTYGQIGLLYLEYENVPNAIDMLETYIEKVDGSPAPRYSKALESARQLVNQNE